MIKNTLENRGLVYEAPACETSEVLANEVICQSFEGNAGDLEEVEW